jgi:hypothetical protein
MLNGVMCTQAISGQYPHGRHSSIGSAGMRRSCGAMFVPGWGHTTCTLCSLHCYQKPFFYHNVAASWWPQGLCAHSHNVLTRL